MNGDPQKHSQPRRIVLRLRLQRLALPSLDRLLARRNLVPALLCLFGALTWWGTGYEYSLISSDPAASLESSVSSAAAGQTKRALEREQRTLLRKLRRYVPRALFIVIDQTHNRLYVHKGDQVWLEAVCSAGSGMILKDTKHGRRWVFDTPRGRFRALTKTRNPVWKKPDWAFIEEGEPIPADPSERFEYGSLGEYAIYFGNGYLIHGTLYERLLGRSVTHGCIRLGRDDLRKVYAATAIGTPIYIY